MKTSTRYSLILANALLALPVIIEGWSPVTVLRVFWWELVPLGLIGVAWIVGARAKGPFQKSRGYQVIFYVAHYSTFCVIYRAVLSRTLWDSGTAPEAFWLWLVPLMIVLATPHFLTFRKDFRHGVDVKVSPTRAMIMPYHRALPVHAVLLVLVALLPATPLGAVILIAAKTVVDAVVGTWYLRRLSGAAPGETTADRAWDR